MPEAILVTNLAATLFMTGLVWFVQVVHYPLFGMVGPDSFGDYHLRHSSRTTLVVTLPMLVELAASVLLVWRHPASASAWQAWLGLVLVLVTWASTFLLQVPSHTRLSSGFSAEDWERLVWTNWFRTAAWTLHAGLLIYMLWGCLG